MRAVDAVMECHKAEGVDVVFGLPVGTESIIASQMGVTRFVAPGPLVPSDTPTLPVAFA